MTKTIGFFGDSFCATMKNDHSKKHQYHTYIEMLKNDLNSKIVNLGVAGTSFWDVYLNQFKPFLDKNIIPDICIFCWPGVSRIYNKKIRYLNSGTVLSVEKTIKNFFYKNIWTASEQYFKYLYDPEKEEQEYLHFLYYLDREIFSNLKDTKILHLWYDKTVCYNFKNGVEIFPNLIELSNFKSNIAFLHDLRPNHLEGTEKNRILFDWIKQGLNTKEDGTVLRFEVKL